MDHSPRKILILIRMCSLTSVYITSLVLFDPTAGLQSRGSLNEDREVADGCCYYSDLIMQLFSMIFVVVGQILSFSVFESVSAQGQISAESA
jgi:hypothetical protein